MVQKSGCAGRVQGGARPHKYCALNRLVKQTLVCPWGGSVEEVRQVAGGWANFVQEPDPECRLSEHVFRFGTSGAKVSDSRVSARLAELVSRRLPNERVVQKHRRLGSAEEPAKPICRPVEASRSSPLMTSATPCRRSSTVTANW